MILSLVFLAVSQMTGSCVLTEGVGSDFAHVGVTTRNSIGTHHSHLTFTFDEKGVLDTIFVFPGSDCRTSKGIKVGDSKEKVQRLYGKGKRSAPRFKGEKVGDYALEYPGVQFVILQGKVALTCIIPIVAEKADG